MQIKKYLKNIKLLKSIYSKYLNLKSNRLLGEKSVLLRNIGDEIIMALYDTIYKKNNKFLWLEFGTLLGAIREQDYIKHDFDIDLGMYSDDFSDDIIIDLEEKGFQIERLFWREDLISKKRVLTEVSFKYKDLNVDIFFSFKKGNYREQYAYIKYDDESLRNRHFAIFKEVYEENGFEEINFRNMIVLVPKDPKHHLALSYGEDFMTPIKNFVREKNLKPHQEVEDFSKYRGVMVGL